MHRIRCYTLFDITQTGVLNRSKPQGNDMTNWLMRRNTQCNFDTLLQVISLRSQPEIIKVPHKIDLTEEYISKFGFLYSFNPDQVESLWRFEFEVQHTSVFEDGIESFGSLYKDCEGVPMILLDGQNENIPKFLNSSPELRNVYFEVV
jgi:hypothetical protein